MAHKINMHFCLQSSIMSRLALSFPAINLHAIIKWLAGILIAISGITNRKVSNINVNSI